MNGPKRKSFERIVTERVQREIRIERLPLTWRTYLEHTGRQTPAPQLLTENEWAAIARRRYG